MWRLLHNLLTTEQRLHHLKKNQSPNCQLCLKNEVDNVWSHSFSSCSYSNPAMEWIVEVLKIMDPTITKEKSVFLEVNPVTNDNILACVWIISETLQYIWAKRKAKDQLNVNDMRAFLLAKLQEICQAKTFQNHATNLTTILSTM